MEELLALETPKKKKNLSDVICYKCKDKGHYANKCPVKDEGELPYPLAQEDHQSRDMPQMPWEEEG